jgi:outer membrane protein OmpA-like peptidoglycan-associated protein
MYPKYIDARSQISVKDKNAKKNLELLIPMSLTDYKLIATVTDSKTKKYISGVSIKLFDVITDRSVFIDGKTDEQGSVSKMLSGKTIGDKIKFEITLKKEKYLSKTEYFEIVLGDEPIIQIPLKLLEIDEVSVGTDIGKIIDINPIYFDLDKAIIRGDAAKELDKMVKVMQENPLIIVELGSHTDCRATAKYNLNLSDRRAKASAAYIISKGIDKKRIYGKGYGESKLINNCACEGSIASPCSEEEHQLNRRTEFRIVKM